MSDDKLENRLYLKRAGIFAAIVILFFALLVLFTLLSRNSWTKGLRYTVAQTLDEAGLSSYSPLDAVELTGSQELNCAVFKSKDGGQYAAVIRITTIYGPLPAVYTWQPKDQKAQFVAFAKLHSKAESQIVNAAINTSIAYWASSLPDIIKSSKDFSEEAR